MNRLRPPIGIFFRSLAGSAAVEFALILPLLCVLLFGFFEIGRAFWTYSVASASARDGARFASRLPMSCAGLTLAGDKARVQRLVRTGTVDTGGTPMVKGWTDDSTVDVTPNCVDNSTGGATYSGRYDGIKSIPTMTVTAQVPFQTIFASLLPDLKLSVVSVENTQAWTE